MQKELDTFKEALVLELLVNEQAIKNGTASKICQMINYESKNPTLQEKEEEVK
jgi:hypothetical protein